MKGIWQWIVGIIVVLALIGLLGFVRSNRQNYDIAHGGSGASTFTDIEWKWTRVIDQSTGTTTTVPDPKIYTITFKADGTLEGRADCNNFAGTYTQDGGFFIKLGPSTLAYCGESSLDTQYLSLLGSVAAGGPDGAGGFALETAGGAQRMEFVK